MDNGAMQFPQHQQQQMMFTPQQQMMFTPMAAEGYFQPNWLPNSTSWSPDFVEQKDNNLFHLGRDIRAEPTIYENLLRVDIRTWDKNGSRTRKGISLPEDCWTSLLMQKDKILQAVTSMQQKEQVQVQFCLGREVYVSIRSPLWLIDIRYWYQDPEGTKKPSRRGISLKFDEFNKLLNVSHDITQELSKLKQ